MKRQVPGLADTARDSRPEIPDGIFLVRVDRAQFRWHAHKPFYVLRLSVLEPKSLAGQPIVGRLYCTPKAMWKLGWFLRDFLYDPELLAHEQVDERALPGLRGVVRSPTPSSTASPLSTSTASPPPASGKNCLPFQCRVLRAPAPTPIPRRPPDDLLLHPD